MANSIRTLFERLQKLPFPQLGKGVGDFPLYDSLIAGTASSVLQGAAVDRESIAVLDNETEEVLNTLKIKPHLNKREFELVEYARLLEELRDEIVKAVSPGWEEKGRQQPFPFHSPNGKPSP